MIELKEDRLTLRFPEVHEAAVLHIDFQRTLRIPDDGKEYPLPAGLGRFPLKSVDDFPTQVPDKWLEHGGVMLPMYQSEALWINFGPGGWFGGLLHGDVHRFQIDFHPLTQKTRLEDRDLQVGEQHVVQGVRSVPEVLELAAKAEKCFVAYLVGLGLRLLSLQHRSGGYQPVGVEQYPLSLLDIEFR